MQSLMDTVSQSVPLKDSAMSETIKASLDQRAHGHMVWHGWELTIPHQDLDSLYVTHGENGTVVLSDMTNQTVPFGLIMM